MRFESLGPVDGPFAQMLLIELGEGALGFNALYRAEAECPQLVARSAHQIHFGLWAWSSALTIADYVLANDDYQESE